MKNFFKEYFSLNNNEQKGIIVLISITLFVAIGTRLYLYFQKPEEVVNTLNIHFESDDLKTENHEEWQNSVESNTDLKKQKKQNSYFTFDPNTVNKDEMLALGFPEKTANILINFRNKGGKFYKKEDLKNVYGVYDELYETVAPYIVIKTESKEKESSKESLEKFPQTDNTAIKPSFKPTIVNINSADSASLTQIKGIGPTFAKRIVKYRDLLGGFIYKKQLLEVYGIDQEKYDDLEKQITVSGTIQTISINTADWNTLKKHPYINNEIAGKITKYREQNGPYKSVDDLVQKQVIPTDIYTKIKPYLSL